MSTDMHRPDMELFNDSLARCLRGGQFFPRFYELFLSSSPEVRDKFRTTDMRKHRRMLQDAFYTLLEYIAMGSPQCLLYLEGIAATHGKQGHDIAPHLYDLWLECLLRTVKACDDLYSPEIDGAWRHMMGPGVIFPKSRYEDPVTGREVSGKGSRV